MINLKVTHFKTHKKGDTLDNCQDAFAINQKIGRYAIADGATLSFFPKEWAELLVSHFCNPEEPDFSFEDFNWCDWIKPIQQRWLENVSKIVQENKSYLLVDRLSNYESALSTFIGMEFNNERDSWNAIVIGDSCLFHIRESEFNSYPLKSLEDFQYRPNSFASFENDNPVGDSPEIINGDVNPDDIFIIATDALSKYIFMHNEIGKRDFIIKELLQIENPKHFEEFVQNARNAELKLVNDDVTLMVVSVMEEINQEEDGNNYKKNAYDMHGLSQSDSDTLDFLIWLIILGLLGFLLVSSMIN